MGTQSKAIERIMYPMWSQYAEVVQRLDPKHIFRNAFLEQLFE